MDATVGKPPGRVDLVGAGPGDPGLLTIRGAEALASAEVVVYDNLANPRLLDLAPSHAERVYAGKSAGRCALPQDRINDLLIDRARRGLRVVRLKGGDPYVFGRGAEEAEALRAEGIPFRVIPGVTAGVGVSAYAGIPVTHRDAASAVAFVTGHHDAGRESRTDWDALSRFPGTLVVYMGVTRLRSVCVALQAGGKSGSTPAALIETGTLASQRTTVSTLAAIADDAERHGVRPPALLIVGDVVDRRAALNWFEELPLFGRTIVITRPQGEAEESARSLEALGAEVLGAPTVEIRPIEDPEPLDRMLRRLAEGDVDWLVFTSSNGVTAVIDRLDALGLDLRAFGRVRLAAIGPTTADALRRHRLNADLVPARYDSEALAEALRPRVAGLSVVLARADRGRDVLRERLSDVARVEQVAVYRNVDAESIPPDVIGRIAEGTVDWITLTSSAIARRLHALLPESARTRIGPRIQLASLSPVTSATARELGWDVAAEARDFTWEGLVSALVDAESSRTPERPDPS